MGISYFLKCVSCNEKLDEIEVEDGWTEDEHDKAYEAWEKLYEKLDPEFYLPWGTISAKSLLKWVNEHKTHGKIEFSAE